jgi:hypothetical protein
LRSAVVLADGKNGDDIGGIDPQAFGVQGKRCFSWKTPKDRDTVK